MADLEELGGPGPVAARLLERPADEDLFDRSGRLLDRQLAARELHLDGIEGLPEALREIVRIDDVAVAEHHRALEKTGGNRTQASKLLEISHRALLYKIKDFGIK